MSSFNHPEGDKLKELNWRLSQLRKRDQGECSPPSPSFDSLMVRFHALKGEESEGGDKQSLESLNARLRSLEVKQEVFSPGSCSLPHQSAPTQGDLVGEDDVEDDDFMEFICQSLNENNTVNQISNSDYINLLDGRLNSAEETADKLLADVINKDNKMEKLDGILQCHQSEIDCIPSNVAITGDSSVRPSTRGNGKTEADLLLEQAKDEVRLLRNPTYRISSSCDNSAQDQINDLMNAAKDSALLEKKYGLQQRNHNKHSSTVTAGKQDTVNEDDKNANEDDDDEYSQSCGSSVSDDSSVGDSD